MWTYRPFHPILGLHYEDGARNLFFEDENRDEPTADPSIATRSINRLEKLEAFENLFKNGTSRATVVTLRIVLRTGALAVSKPIRTRTTL